MINILNDIINSNSIVSAITIIRYNPNLLDWLNNETNQYSPKKISEMVYIVINGQPPKCKCGNNKIFNTFTTGYRSGCILKNKCLSVKEDRINNQKLTLIQRYGVDTTGQISGSLEKRKATMKERFGVEFASQNLDIKLRQLETFNSRTNKEKEESKQKTVSTNLAKYGVEHHMKLATQQEKLKSTNLERYGVELPLQNKDINKKFRKTLANRTVEDIKNKNLVHKNNLIQKYNVESSMQVHIGKNTLNILNNKVQFDKTIHSLTREEACKKFGISDTYLRKFTAMHQSYSLYKRPEKSKEEQEICDFLTIIGIKYVESSRQIISPKEIDIYIPSHNIAIEYSSLYWHSENSSGRDSKYHKLKFDKCTDQGIQLITIFGDEWEYKKDLCKSMIRNVLGMSTRIYARQCSILEVDALTQKVFLTTNHLQGNIGSNKAFGLYYNDELVSLMSFGRSRFKNNSQIELLRFCNKLGISIVGGASKLLSHYKKLYTPESIVSYCDNRWFSGALYESLGFTQTTTTVGYYYTDYRERWSRIKFQKHKIKNLVENGNIQTEWQIMQSLGYDRIWDCGQTTWVYNSINNNRGIS